MKHLPAMLFIPLVFCGCGTVTVGLGSTLNGSADSTTDGTSTGTSGATGTTTGGAGTGGTTGSGTTTVPIPTTCTANGDTFDNYAKAVLTAHCTSGGCHNGKFDTLAEVQSDASMEQQYITNGVMPPSGQTPLDSNEKARLVNWYLCKTP